MIFLLLSIISSASIFVIFKLLNKYKIPVFNVIVINYIAAATLGFLISSVEIKFSDILSANWLPFSFLIGILFIVFFYIIGLSSQKAGISITTVASKMSVVIPILFSIVYYSETINSLKISGIVLAIFAVGFTVYKKHTQQTDSSNIYLPLILFIGMGVVDSMVKYSQHEFVNNELSAIFSAILFSVAAFTGITISLLKKQTITNFKNPLVWINGSLLGIANYGSIYFLILTLNNNIFDSSVIFGINNIGIVSLSVLVGLLAFKEKLKPINWFGIGLSLIAIVLLSMT